MGIYFGNEVKIVGSPSSIQSIYDLLLERKSEDQCGFAYPGSTVWRSSLDERNYQSVFSFLGDVRVWEDYTDVASGFMTIHFDSKREPPFRYDDPYFLMFCKEYDVEMKGLSYCYDYPSLESIYVRKDPSGEYQSYNGNGFGMNLEDEEVWIDCLSGFPPVGVPEWVLDNLKSMGESVLENRIEEASEDPSLYDPKDVLFWKGLVSQ